MSPRTYQGARQNPSFCLLDACHYTQPSAPYGAGGFFVVRYDMAQVKVQNHGPSPLALSEGITLEVGSTHVDADKLKRALGVSAKVLQIFQAQCTLFAEQPEGRVDSEPARAATLVSLTTRAALNVIKKCEDVAQLKRWVEDDARPAVQKALHLRWRELVPALPEGEADITIKVSQ